MLVQRLLGHFRANLIAYLALFIALSGTTYAGVKVTLPRDSVGTTQIKNGAVTKQKLAGSAVRAFVGKRGPRGPSGPQGLPGPAGPTGDFTGATAGGDLQGTFPSPEIRTGAVTAEKIAIGAISAFQTAPSVGWVPLSDTRFVGQGFLNGWHSAAGPWQGPEYYFDFFGDLHLRGSIAGGTVSSSASGAAFWFCGVDVTSPPAAFEVPTETAGGAFVPGEVEIVNESPPPRLCGVAGTSVAWSMFEVRVVAGSNNRVSLDGISMYFDEYGYGGSGRQPRCPTCG
jgi:hypothetical protein